MSQDETGSSPWHRDHPYLATLRSQRCLTAPGSDKDVRHIEIDIGDSGMQWQPGDTLGVWIRNDPELVAELLARVGLDGMEKIEIDGKLFSLATLLTEVLEVTQAHPGFVKHYAEATGLAELQALAADPKALRSYLDKRQIVDVLKAWPATLAPAAFIACFRHMMPRQYSIASSARVDPRCIHLTVGQVVWQENDSLRKGAGSVYLGYRVQVGQQVPVFTVSNPNFRLPDDDNCPIIMIGPGTGIAPFRAFLQERAARAAAGPNWLLFGNPHRHSDYLYADELEAWQHSGLLTRLDLAFSRDQPEKRYVQHCLQEQAAEVFRWLEQGACLYVCGDARHMAEDVQKALLDIIAQQGGMDAAAARQYLVRMRQQKRYQRDVY